MQYLQSIKLIQFIVLNSIKVIESLVQYCFSIRLFTNLIMRGKQMKIRLYNKILKAPYLLSQFMHVQNIHGKQTCLLMTMVDNECRVSQGGDEEHDNSTILEREGVQNLQPRNARLVYLITYSKADLSLVRTREVTPLRMMTSIFSRKIIQSLPILTIQLLPTQVWLFERMIWQEHFNPVAVNKRENA